MALLAEQIPKDDGIGLELGCEADLLGAGLNPGFGLASFGDARQIAFHVGAEHRHALGGEAFGEALQRHRLAGAGRAGDEPVAVREPEIDELGLDALADIDAVFGRRGRSLGLALALLRRCLALRHPLLSSFFVSHFSFCATARKEKAPPASAALWLHARRGREPLRA